MNGNEKDIIPFDKNGKGHGYWERYHDNGNLHFKTNYIHGVIHGYLKSYKRDGSIYFEGEYIYGKMSGIWLWHNHHDRLSEKYYYV